MNRRNFALALLTAITLTAPLAHAENDTLARIQQTRKIRIAIDPNLPPWSFKNDKLEMTGSEYETAQLLASDIGATLEMVPTNGASRIPLLLTDKAGSFAFNCDVFCGSGHEDMGGTLVVTE